MEEQKFQELLIRVIEGDNYQHKQELLELLSRSRLTCDKTNEFTKKKWDHYKEYIYITTNPEDVSKLTAFKDYLEEKIRWIYPVEDDYEYEFFGLEIKPGFTKVNEFVSQEIFFDDIQKQIVDELKSAKYIIWVAMAWFTSPVLFEELVKAKRRGVNVQVIVDNNQKNRGAPFTLEKEFETYRIDVSSCFPNLMHNKFCMIDLSTVIHGTFNWTNAANFNRETISIDRNSVTAQKFADEFIKLKQRQYG